MRKPTFASDLKEMMTAWDKVMAAAKMTFPDATPDERYHIVSRVMARNLKLGKEASHAHA